MPVRLAVTGGTVADCSLALPLIEGIEAECLLADKAYDTKAYDTKAYDTKAYDTKAYDTKA